MTTATATRPLFSSLKYERHQCNPSYKNTCALSLSKTLDDADSKVYSAIKANGSKANKCNDGYFRGCDDLAAAIQSTWGNRDVGKENPKECPEEIKGKKGVIFFRFPSSSAPDAAKGHIDLWNGKSTVGGASYFDGETLLWFWELKEK